MGEDLEGLRVIVSVRLETPVLKAVFIFLSLCFNNFNFLDYLIAIWQQSTVRSGKS